MIAKKLSLEEFKAIYAKVPRICVELVVLDSKKRVLLTLRDIEPWKGFWHLPGGGLLFSESLDDAVKRVAKEELGVDIVIKKMLGTIEFKPSKLFYGHVVSLPYLVVLKSDKIVLDNQARDFKYFKKLPQNIISEHKKFLKNLLKS